MGKEIEHKYLVTSSDWKNNMISKHEIQQGYLSTDPEKTIRIRLVDDKAKITIKGKNIIDTRAEFEYEIPFTDGEELMKLCGKHTLSKTRYLVPYGNHIWEIDVFKQRHKGLILAEIELSKSNEYYLKPTWIGENVTNNAHFYNSNLSKN